MGRTRSRNVKRTCITHYVGKLVVKTPVERMRRSIVLRYIFQVQVSVLWWALVLVMFSVWVFLPQRWFYINVPRYGFHNLKLVLL
jgi:hypothetical protein